jgi:hypothetical protein
MGILDKVKDFFGKKDEADNAAAAPSEPKAEDATEELPTKE